MSTDTITVYLEIKSTAEVGLPADEYAAHKQAGDLVEWIDEQLQGPIGDLAAHAHDGEFSWEIDEDPPKLTEDAAKELDERIPDGAVLAVRGDDDDVERYRVIWKNCDAAALRGMPDECWFDDSADPATLWQHIQYADAVYRVDESPLRRKR